MDIITYALLKKQIATSATGISKIDLLDNNGKYQLSFEMGDGSNIEVNLPIKSDCIDFQFVSTLPVSNISPTTVYLVPLNSSNDIVVQYMFVDGAWRKLGASGLPYAEEGQAGIVAPDGSSIVISNGVISISDDYVNGLIDDRKIDESEIQKLFAI